MIHVALCFTDPKGTYYKHALVTALSVLDNCRSPLCLHVVHDETLGEEQKALFADLCERHGQSIRFCHAGQIPEETVSNVPSFLGKGALFKTMLPSLIDEDKVLYLDCDIVCLADVATIFAFDLGEAFLGVAKMDREQGRNWARKLGLTCGFCINTGVLLMNLKKIRQEIPDFTTRVFEAARKARVKVGDQGAIALFFDTRPEAYTFLPEYCNLRTEQKDNALWPMADYQGQVIHFAGKKPWQTLSTPGLHYWKYYSRLFPDTDVFALLESLAPLEHNALYRHAAKNRRVLRWIARSAELSAKGLPAMLLGRLKRLLPKQHS